MKELRRDTRRKRFLITEIAISSANTTISAMTMAVLRSVMRNGRAWNTPPRVVIAPVTRPRMTPVPRSVCL